MKYTVKRGYSYVNPADGRVTQAGYEVEGEIDHTQKWKLHGPGTLEQASEPSKVVNKNQTYDEATELLIKKRDEVTAARRAQRTKESADGVAQARQDAKTVKSNSVKTKKPIQPEDYDEMDEGEETE
jgi:hypothetical protein